MTIEQLVNDELEKADIKHGRTIYDWHHGYAIIKEEIEETDEAVQDVKRDLNNIWIAVTNDADISMSRLLNQMEKDADHMIKESIQVMAMCKKIRRELIE